MNWVQGGIRIIYHDTAAYGEEVQYFMCGLKLQAFRHFTQTWTLLVWMCVLLEWVYIRILYVTGWNVLYEDTVRNMLHFTASVPPNHPLSKTPCRCVPKTKLSLLNKNKRKEKKQISPTLLYFSENYIFGKFDAFCRRLEKIADMVSTLENLAPLQSIKVVWTGF